MINKEKIIKFAQEQGYDSAEYLGKWNGYDVFEPVFNDEEEHSVGYPLSILSKNNELRWTDNKECFKVLSFFDNEE